MHVVGELTGVAIPKRSAEQIVIDAAADVDGFYERDPHSRTVTDAAAAALSDSSLLDALLRTPPLPNSGLIPGRWP